MSEIPPTSSSEQGPTLSFGEVFSLAWGVAKLDDRSIEAALSPRVGLALPLLLVPIGGGLSGAMGGLPGVIGAAIVGLIGFAILVGYCHLVAQLLGGHGDLTELGRLLAVGSLPRWIAVIPVLGIIGMLWYAAVVVKALMRTHGLSMGAAAVVVALPLLLLVVGSILLMLGIFSAAILAPGHGVL